MVTMKLLLFLLPWLLCRLSALEHSSSSSGRVVSWLLKHAPGAYARDIRVLSDLVSWESMNVTMHSVDIRGLCIVLENDDLVTIKRLRCSVSLHPQKWSTIIAISELEVEEPRVKIVARDPFLMDTNWRRFGKKLSTDLHALKTGTPSHSATSLKNKSSTFQAILGVKRFKFDGAAVATITPCDALGGKDAEVTIRLELDRDLAPLSSKIAEKADINGYLTVAQVTELIKEDVSARIKAALKEALMKKKKLGLKLDSTTTIGEVQVGSLSDVRAAATNIFKSKMTTFIQRATSAIPGLDQSEATSLADLLQEYGAHTITSLRTPTPIAENNPTLPPSNTDDATILHETKTSPSSSHEEALDAAAKEKKEEGDAAHHNIERHYYH